jgi:hypothetical protein
MKSQIQFLSFFFLQSFHSSLKGKIRELWKRGFVPTKYISMIEINY